MKIRLITFHTPKNYGAVLQGFSLMCYLKTLSDDVKVIDYDTQALRARYPLFVKFKGVKGFAVSTLSLLHLPAKKRKFRKFGKFVREKYDLTSPYASTQALYDICCGADIYVTGSDQVFNPKRLIDERKAFYLDFAEKGARKVSYAASFGVKSIPKGTEAEIAAYLMSFDSISVREESGVDIVKAVANREAIEVLDPVFLQDRAFWTALIKPYKKQFKNYLFYYRLMGTRESDAQARRIAKEKNLKLVVMTDGILRWYTKHVIRDVGPEEFLFLLSNASYVVTDSFHGVAFSLIMQKQFAFSDYSEETSERAIHLLNRLGAQSSACKNGDPLQKELDYAIISKRIFELVKHSKEFIQGAISN